MTEEELTATTPFEYTGTGKNDSVHTALQRALAVAGQQFCRILDAKTVDLLFGTIDGDDAVGIRIERGMGVQLADLTKTAMDTDGITPAKATIRTILKDHDEHVVLKTGQHTQEMTDDLRKTLESRIEVVRDITMMMTKKAKEEGYRSSDVLSVCMTLLSVLYGFEYKKGKEIDVRVALDGEPVYKNKLPLVRFEEE